MLDLRRVLHERRRPIPGRWRGGRPTLREAPDLRPLGVRQRAVLLAGGADELLDPADVPANAADADRLVHADGGSEIHPTAARPDRLFQTPARRALLDRSRIAQQACPRAGDEDRVAIGERPDRRAARA